jgi:hypothetical protein
MTGFTVILRRSLYQWMAIAVVSSTVMTAKAAQDGTLVPVPDLNIPPQSQVPAVPLTIVPVALSQDGSGSSIPVGPSATLPPVEPLVNAPISDNNSVTDDDALLRGPVHEAFAEQYNQDPVEGLIVPQQPPEPVEELAPDVRPDGRQVEWISGYWAWDDDSQDFFWVSGIWREVPQGFRWIPGYWTEAATGWQWVSGTWVSAATEELEYVEMAPPESLELGPVGVAPTVEHIWIPGCWQWNTNRYAWRPGFWSGGYANWCWIPARHVWTPRGYFYSNGYWDYPLARRGMLFAPYRFRNPARWNRGYRFTPQVVIATNLIQLNFWVRPRYRHYYFGDYYNNAYLARGFQPWHRFNQQRRQFDPLFAYTSRVQSVGNRNYFNQMDQRFELLAQSPDRRPIHSFSHQNRQLISGRFDDVNVRAGALGSTLHDHMQATRDVRFVKLEQVTRDRVQSESRQVREIGIQRREIERAIKPVANGNGVVSRKTLPQNRNQEHVADSLQDKNSTLPRPDRNRGEDHELKSRPDRHLPSVTEKSKPDSLTRDGLSRSTVTDTKRLERTPEQKTEQKPARLRLPPARNVNTAATGLKHSSDANAAASVQRRAIDSRSVQSDPGSAINRPRTLTPRGETQHPTLGQTLRGNANNEATSTPRRTIEPRNFRNEPGKSAPAPNLDTLRKSSPESTIPRTTVPRATTQSPLRDPILRGGSVNLESAPLQRRLPESRPVSGDSARPKPSSPGSVTPRITSPKASVNSVPRTIERQPSSPVQRRAVESRPAPSRPERSTPAPRAAAPKASSAPASRSNAGQSGGSRPSRPASPSGGKSGGSGGRK